jgi:hypothetical protein
MSGPFNLCPHCGRMVQCYVTAQGTVHLYGHRIDAPGHRGSERGPWCPQSGAAA